MATSTETHHTHSHLIGAVTKPHGCNVASDHKGVRGGLWVATVVDKLQHGGIQRVGQAVAEQGGHAAVLELGQQASDEVVDGRRCDPVCMFDGERKSEGWCDVGAVCVHTFAELQVASFGAWHKCQHSSHATASLQGLLLDVPVHALMQLLILLLVHGELCV